MNEAEYTPAYCVVVKKDVLYIENRYLLKRSASCQAVCLSRSTQDNMLLAARLNEVLRTYILVICSVTHSALLISDRAAKLVR